MTCKNFVEMMLCKHPNLQFLRNLQPGEHRFGKDAKCLFYCPDCEMRQERNYTVVDGVAKQSLTT